MTVEPIRPEPLGKIDWALLVLPVGYALALVAYLVWTWTPASIGAAAACLLTTVVVLRIVRRTISSVDRDGAVLENA